MRSRIGRILGSKKSLLVFTIAFAMAGPARPQGPVFADLHDLDAEYELDRLMNRFPWEWRGRFWAVPTGFRITGGSLNIRHLYIRQEAKIRFPLIQEKFAFRFRHEKNQGLERDELKAEVELETRPWPGWFLSLVGEPAFHKSDAGAGFAVRRGEAEGRSLRLAYLWPSFDNNYAFHNRSVNEGYEEFYRRARQEARLRATWESGALGFRAEGRWARPWERVHQDFATPAIRYVERGSEAEFLLDARWRNRIGVWRLEGETWRNRESIAFEPADPAADRSLVEERSLLNAAFERRLAERWRMEIGGGPAASRGRLRRPGDPASDRAYNIQDRLAWLSSFHELKPRLWLEAGYVYDRQQWRGLQPGFSRDGRDRSGNRGKLALQYDLAAGASFRAAAAIELDRNESERFFTFDGGTIQFQTTF